MESLEVKRKAAYRRLMPYWLMTVPTPHDSLAKGWLSLSDVRAGYRHIELQQALTQSFSMTWCVQSCLGLGSSCVIGWATWCVQSCLGLGSSCVIGWAIWRRFSVRNYDNTCICIKSIEPASLVGPFTISLGLGLATLTGSHMHCGSDARYSPRSQDLALTSQG